MLSTIGLNGSSHKTLKVASWPEILHPEESVRTHQGHNTGQGTGKASSQEKGNGKREGTEKEEARDTSPFEVHGDASVIEAFRGKCTLRRYSWQNNKIPSSPSDNGAISFQGGKGITC